MRKEIRMFPGKHTDFSLILDFFFHWVYTIHH